MRFSFACVPMCVRALCLVVRFVSLFGEIDVVTFFLAAPFSSLTRAALLRRSNAGVEPEEQLVRQALVV